ncbi:MAG: hypothetical protein P1U56_11760 [Saprospiraceae bacterium]|nr:hypothetical protein [Saprospiraceae bacterium]
MRYLSFVLVVLFLISCDNELDLVAENREVPVVYGLIDQADTAQYIRVERIFVDKEISGNVIAQNPDSLYYENISVKLIRLENGQEYTLTRVDGNVEGYVRDEGAFADSPNYLYKIRTDSIPLIEYEEYELRIDGIFEDRSVTSTATILEPPFLLNPMSGGLISFEPNKKVNIGWTPKGDAEIFTTVFYFNITENTGGQFLDKRLAWIVDSNTDKSNIEADGIDFFSFLSGALTEDEEIRRTLNSIEFELISGNKSIEDYIRVGQANLGITSSGEIPILSNLSEGLGVFGSTHTHRRTNIQLTQSSRDSLINGSITSDLNFQ